MSVKTPKIINNQSGAIMVIGVVSAIFLCGILYHVAGVGGAALEHQIMQDAADSTAFSTAAAKARMMNILTMINLIMAAILAVLVALRIAQMLLCVAIGVAIAGCILPFTSFGCGYIYPLSQTEIRVKNAADKAEKAIKKILTALSKAQKAINEVSPAIAQAEAVYISTHSVYDPATAGFAWPLINKLPVKEGKFSTLCAKAADNVGEAFFSLVPLPRFIEKAITGVVTNIAKRAPLYFCGSSDGSSPKHKVKITKAIPSPREKSDEHPEGHDECNKIGGSANVDKDKKISRGWGCSSEYASDDCKKCAYIGCTGCMQEIGKSGYKNGSWTIRIINWKETQKKGVTIPGEESKEEPYTFSTNDNPCEGEIISCNESPVCKKEQRKVVSDTGYGEDRIIITQVTRMEYLYFHSCVYEEEETKTLSGKKFKANEMPKPMVLDKEKYKTDGKIKSYVLGGSDKSKRLKLVGMGRANDTGISLNNRVSFARAEFLSKEMDMWHLTWRSRLLRFKFTQKDNEQNLTSSCSGIFSSKCNEVGQKVGGLKSSGSAWKDYILH